MSRAAPAPRGRDSTTTSPVTTLRFVRRGALAALVCGSLGACWPEVQDGAAAKVGTGAVGGTPNRDNSQAGVNSTIAPPGQGSALGDTAAGRLAPAGVSGPTQGLSKAAPTPTNANAQTRSPTADSTTPNATAPRASSPAPAPRTP